MRVAGIRAVVATAGLSMGMVMSQGCIQPVKPNAATRSPKDDIFEVAAFFSPTPWLNFDEDPDPEGFKVTLYLRSSTTNRGEFGSGLIRVQMFRITRGAPEESTTRELVHEWTLDPDQAKPYRSVRPSVLGWGYGLRLNWKDADVLGCDIRVVISYERLDGKIISGQPKSLVVPGKKAYN